MKHFLTLNLVFILILNINTFGQNNLITTNPDFLINTNGWTGRGSDVNFTHVSNGAVTPGAASLEVISTNGDERKAVFNSSTINITGNNIQDKYLFLTFYAKSSAPRKIRIRFYIKNSDGTQRVVKEYCNLTTSYRQFCVPVYIKDGDNRFKFLALCGSQTGTYFFDDFNAIVDIINPKQISQFEQRNNKIFEIPSLIQNKTLNTGNSNIKIKINRDTILAPVLNTQFGVNSNFRSSNSIVNRSHLYEQFGSFRFPSGSGSDIYFWDGVQPSFHQNFGFYSGTSDRFMNPEHYAQFKNLANGEGSIVVNYGYARYGAAEPRSARVQNAADLAAGFVNEMNNNLHADIKYWEVGNEIYGGWEAGHTVNDRGEVTGKEYGEDFCVFAETMKRADPDIKIGAVLYSRPGAWNTDVITETKDHADYYIIHHYLENITSANASKNNVKGLESDMQEIQKFIEVFSGKPAGYYPLNITEFNMKIDGNQGEQTITMSNGLFIADILGTLVKNHYNLSTIWLNEWGLSGPNNNKTHGIIVRDGNENQIQWSVRPSYTPYYYYGKCFGDQMIKSEVSGSDDIRAYASKFSSGEIGIVAINFSDQDKDIVFENIADYDTVYWYSVNADNINAGNTKFYVNGQTSTTTGGGPVNLDNVPVNCAEISSNNNFTLPKYSANYIVLSSSRNFWNGSTDTDWFKSSNWTKNEIPKGTCLSGNGTDAIIPNVSNESGNFPLIEGSDIAECDNLKICTNAKVDIANNGKLTVCGNITNNAGQTGLNIFSDNSSSGSLISSSVNIQANVQTNLSGTCYHYISSPVLNTSVNLFNTNNLYYWDASAEWGGIGNNPPSTIDFSPWVNITSGNLEVTKGYAYHNLPSTITYNGILNVGNKTITLYKNANGAINDQGWNLIGNPYPSAIDWDKVVSSNFPNINTELESAIYFFNDDGTGIQANYRYYVPAGGTGGTGGIGTGNATKDIPPGQGFFVKALQNNVSLEILNTDRIHSSQIFYKETPENLLRIKIINTDVEDELVVRMAENATLNFDGAFDARKLLVYDVDFPQFFTITEDKTFSAINSIPVELSETCNIPIGFIALAGDYSFKITEQTFNKKIKIYLYDDKFKTENELIEGTQYNFSFDGSLNTKRFKLIFKNTITNTENIRTNRDISIFPNPGKNAVFNVNLNNINTDYYEIYDISGKLLIKNICPDNNFYINLSEYSRGIYFMKIKTNDKIFNIKLITQ